MPHSNLSHESFAELFDLNDLKSASSSDNPSRDPSVPSLDTQASSFPADPGHSHVQAAFPEYLRFKDTDSGEYIIYKRINLPATRLAPLKRPDLPLARDIFNIGSYSLIVATNLLAFAIGWFLGQHNMPEDF